MLSNVFFSNHTVCGDNVEESYRAGDVADGSILQVMRFLMLDN